MAENYMNLEGSYYEDALEKGQKSQKFIYKARYDYLLQFLNLKKNDNLKILDIGCGSGIIVRKLSKELRESELVGIDLSKATIDHCKKQAENEKLKNIVFKEGTIEEIPFENESFDLIVCSEVIEHIANTERAFKEINRVLKKNGTLILSTPNYASLWPLAEFVFDKLIARKDYSLEEQHVSKFTFKSIRKELEKHGFEIEEEKTLLFFSLPFSVLSQTIAESLLEIDKKLSCLPLGMLVFVKGKKIK